MTSISTRTILLSTLFFLIGIMGFAADLYTFPKTPSASEREFLTLKELVSKKAYNDALQLLISRDWSSYRVTDACDRALRVLAQKEAAQLSYKDIPALLLSFRLNPKTIPVDRPSDEYNFNDSLGSDSHKIKDVIAMFQSLISRQTIEAAAISDIFDQETNYAEFSIDDQKLFLNVIMPDILRIGLKNHSAFYLHEFGEICEKLGLANLAWQAYEIALVANRDLQNIYLVEYLRDIARVSTVPLKDLVTKYRSILIADASKDSQFLDIRPLVTLLLEHGYEDEAIGLISKSTKRDLHLLITTQESKYRRWFDWIQCAAAIPDKGLDLASSLLNEHRDSIRKLRDFPTDSGVHWELREAKILAAELKIDLE